MMIFWCFRIKDEDEDLDELMNARDDPNGNNPHKVNLLFRISCIFPFYL
jgi:hypothetical protein